MDKGIRINHGVYPPDNSSNQPQPKAKKKVKGKTGDSKSVITIDLSKTETVEYKSNIEKTSLSKIETRNIIQKDQEDHVLSGVVDLNKALLIDKEHMLSMLKEALSETAIFNNPQETVVKLLKEVADKSVEEALISPAFSEAKRLIDTELNKGSDKVKVTFHEWLAKVLHPYKKNLDQLPDPLQELVAAGVVVLEDKIEELIDQGVEYLKDTIATIEDSLQEQLLELTDNIKGELTEWFDDLKEPLNVFTENLPEPLQAEIEKGLEYLKDNFLDKELEDSETLTQLSNKLTEWKNDLEFSTQSVENDLLSAQNDLFYLNQELEELTPFFNDATKLHGQLSSNLQTAVADLKQSKIDQLKYPEESEKFLEDQAQLQTEIDVLKESIEQNQLLLDEYTNDIEETIKDINQVESDILEFQTQTTEIETVHMLTDDLIKETAEKIKDSSEGEVKIDDAMIEEVDKAGELKEAAVVSDAGHDVSDTFDIPEMIGDRLLDAFTEPASLGTAAAANLLSNSWLLYKTEKKYMKIEKRNLVFSGSDEIFNKWNDKPYDYSNKPIEFDDFKDFYFLCNFNDLDQSKQDFFNSSGLGEFEQQKNIIIQDKCIVNSEECASFLKDFQGLLKSCMGQPGAVLGEKESELAKDYDKLSSWLRELNSRSATYKMNVNGEVAPDERGRVSAAQSLKMMRKLERITKKYGVVIKYDTVGKRLKKNRRAAVHRISIRQDKFFKLLKSSNKLPDYNAIKTYAQSQENALENLKEFKDYEKYKLKHARSNNKRAKAALLLGFVPLVPIDKGLRAMSEHKIYTRRKKSIGRLKYRLDQVKSKKDQYNKKLIALIEDRLDLAGTVKTKHMNIKRKEAKRNRNVDITASVAQTILSPVPFAGTGVTLTGAVARFGVGYAATRTRRIFDKKAYRRKEFETPESVYKRLKVEYNKHKDLQKDIIQMCFDLFGLSEKQTVILMKMPPGHDLVYEKKMVKLSFSRPLENKELDKAIVKKKKHDQII